MIEEIRWIALGLALVNHEFANALYRRVGPNGFRDGAAGLVYDQIEARNNDKVREILGLCPIGKVSEAVLKYLEKEAMERWKLRTQKEGHGKARKLVKEIDDALKVLLAMARHDGERRDVQWIEDDYGPGDGI